MCEAVVRFFRVCQTNLGVVDGDSAIGTCSRADRGGRPKRMFNKPRHWKEPRRQQGTEPHHPAGLSPERKELFRITDGLEGKQADVMRPKKPQHYQVLPWALRDVPGQLLDPTWTPNTTPPDPGFMESTTMNTMRVKRRAKYTTSPGYDNYSPPSPACQQIPTKKRRKPAVHCLTRPNPQDLRKKTGRDAI
jgi:hypothetical protein